MRRDGGSCSTSAMAAATPRSKTEAGPGFQGQVWLLRYETVVSGHCSTEKRLLPRCRVVLCRQVTGGRSCFRWKECALWNGTARY